MATAEEIKAMKGSDEPLPDLKAMYEEIKRLRQENEEFKKRIRPVTFSINDKGAVCMHGLGKYPVQLYKVQWERILEHGDELKDYIEKNKDKLN